MSILINQESINILIYRYLLEAGMKHTAFNLFNEAKLETSKIDTASLPSGMLIHYLEKALTLMQLESHIYKNQLQECVENFELIIPHKCRIVENKRNDKLAELTQFNSDINAILNDNSKEEPTQSDMMTKIKIGGTEILDIALNPKQGLLATFCESDNFIGVWKITNETNSKSIRVVWIVNFQNFHVIGDKPAFLTWDLAGGYLLVIFEGGTVIIFDDKGSLKNWFQVDSSFSAEKIVWNKYDNRKLAIPYETEYGIVDPLTETMIDAKKDMIKMLAWQSSSNYAVLTRDNLIYYYEDSMQKNTYAADQYSESITWNNTGMFLVSFSKHLNAFKIWVLENTNYLYSYQDTEKITDCSWNDGDDDNCMMNFLVIQYVNYVKIFDLEYGIIKHKIEIDDKSPLSRILLFNKDTMIMAILEEGDVSIFTLQSKKKVYSTRSKVMRNLEKYDEWNVIGSYENKLVFVDLKKGFQ